MHMIGSQRSTLSCQNSSMEYVSTTSPKSVSRFFVSKSSCVLNSGFGMKFDAFRHNKSSNGWKIRRNFYILVHSTTYRRYILDFWLVEMSISTNPNRMIYIVTCARIRPLGCQRVDGIRIRPLGCQRVDGIRIRSLSCQRLMVLQYGP